MHTVHCCAMQTCSHCIALFTAACGVSAEFGSSVVPCAEGLPPERPIWSRPGQVGEGEHHQPDDENITTMQQLSAQSPTQSNTRAAAAKKYAAASQIAELTHLIIGLLAAGIKSGQLPWRF